jgi:hypothetical protein
MSRLVAVALLLLGLSAARAEPELRVGVVFHVVDGSASDAFVQTQLEHARTIYGPLGIALEERGRLSMPAQHARLVSRRDRDALASRVRPGVVNCMVVAELMDVDEPGRVRRGVHWRPRHDAQRRFVIVSAISGPWVLAHELGHFFGNRAHSDVPNNLMSYLLTGGVPFLDARQVETVQASVAALQARGELTAPP